MNRVKLLAYFRLKTYKTTVRREFSAGFTTFLTMVYIVPVNMLIMSAAGMPKEALLSATALITILSCILNGLWANIPVALSVGMGLNAYFTYGLCIGMGIPWQTALGAVFIAAALLTALSLTRFRVWIMETIPLDLRRAISAGIGAFICFVGMKQMGFVVANPATYVAIGDVSDPKVLIGVIGIVFVVSFWALNVKGGFILAVAATSLIAWFFDIYPAPKSVFSMPASIAPIFGQLDIAAAFKLSLAPAILTIFITHLFDSMGTLTGVCNRAKLFDREDKGNVKKIAKSLACDASASMAGAIVGTSTVTAFAESAAGVEAGGKTGLTAIFTGLLFVFTLFMLPLFEAIPENAIYPVLVMVGVLMFGELGKIDFSNPAICVATFFTVILMPLTYSITVGLSVAFMSYFIVNLVLRKYSNLNAGVVTLALISLIVFLAISAPGLFGKLLGTN